MYSVSKSHFHGNMVLRVQTVFNNALLLGFFSHLRSHHFSFKILLVFFSVNADKEGHFHMATAQELSFMFWRICTDFKYNTFSILTDVKHNTKCKTLL